MKFGTPVPERVVDQRLARALLLEQHPDLAELPIRLLGEGWDNTMLRLGDDLMLRFPRREFARRLLRREQEWLPRIAGRLTLPVPSPVRIGRPGHDYPWEWSVLPWIEGKTADLDHPSSSEAASFGRFLRSLHQPAPQDAPSSTSRGVPLADRVNMVDGCLDWLEGRTELITPEILAIWRDALAAPIDTPSVWLHGDLHPWNVLVQNGTITGVIDWGDMTSGDPATDLAALWMLFEEPNARAAVIAAYGDISESTRRRARGWAIFFGVVMLSAGLVDNDAFVEIGRRTLDRLEKEDSPGPDQ